MEREMIIHGFCYLWVELALPFSLQMSLFSCFTEEAKYFFTSILFTEIRLEAP